MKTNKKFPFCILIITSTLFLNHCVKQEFDEPPSQIFTLDFKSNTSIAELKAMFTGGDTLKITDDIIIEAIVISSDKEGNFYKELVIQDQTAGIAIQLDKSYIYNDYPIGQKLLVKCKNLYLGTDGGVIQLGSLYDDDGVIKFGRIQGDAVIDEHIFKDAGGQAIQPDTIVISEINDTLLYTLIKIDSVQFKSNELSYTYADAVNNEDKNRYLEDCNENEIILRTSGYANFAGDTLPQGNGSITAILGKYGTDYQLYINATDDVNLTGNRCAGSGTTLLYKDFEDNSLTSGGWTTQIVIGTTNWEVNEYDNNKYAKASNGGNSESEAWYISPAIDLTGTSNPILNFDNTCNYDGAEIELKVSTDYDGSGAPSSAIWSDLSPNLSSGSWNWANSGDLALSAYIANSVYIAFKYTGTNSDGKAWEVDNITVTAQ